MRLAQSTGLPGPARRLSRSPFTLFVLGLMALLVASIAQVGESAAVSIESNVDQHWRGAYDILVRPPGTRLDLEKTNSLVEPNFLGFTGRGGIDRSQLDRIRSDPDVEVAAPVSVIGEMKYVFTAPSIFISDLPAAPTLFRVTTNVETSDGLSARLVQSRTTRVLLGPADLGAGEVPFATNERGLSWSADGVSIGLPELPPIVSPLVAIDPVAEMSLLGPSGSVFSPLRDFTAPDKRTVSGIDINQVPAEFDSERFFLQLLSGSGDETANRPVVPIVVSSKLYAPLHLRMTVEQVGSPLDTYPPPGASLERLSQAETEAGPGSSVVGETNIDASGSLRPFQPPSLTILWPGGSPPDGTEIASRVSNDFVANLSQRPTYVVKTSDQSGLNVVIEPQGLVDPVGSTTDTRGQGDVGQVTRGVEQSYRKFEEVPLAVGAGFAPKNPFDRPFVLVPVGTYDLDKFAFPKDSLSYVPLGAYDPSDTTLIRNSDGVAVDGVAGKPLTPTLNAAGLVAVPPLAFTDIDGATLLRGPRSIDAIRVRVRGIAGYDDASRKAVEAVAARITQLGLDVDIVAGSSPQDVSIYVPAYDVATQPPGDLGTVRQGWTTLGAAARVTTGLSGINTVLVGLTALLTLALVVSLEVVTFGTRQRDIAIMLAVGWSRRRVAWWLIEEGILSGAALLVLAILAATIAGHASGMVAACSLVAAFVAVRAVGAISVVLRSRHRAVQQGDVSTSIASPIRVRGPWTLALRSTTARIWRTLALVGAIGAGSAALGIGAAVVGGALIAVGPTRLAIAVSSRVLPYQLGILAILGFAGMSLAYALRRVDLRDRASEFRVMAVVGWSRAEIATAIQRQDLLWLLPGGLLGAAGAWLGATSLAATGPGAAAGLAGLFALFVAVVSLLIANRAARVAVTPR